MEFLKDLGIVGFWFFFIKGLLWIVLFALVYFGVVDKKKVQNLRSKLSFRKKSKADDSTDT